MKNKLSIKVLFSVFLGLLFFSPVFAQTIRLVPQNIETDLNSDFSLTLEVESVTDLFGVAFDLSFDPSLITFVSAEEGDFLSSGCATSLLTSESPSGTIIAGLTRLGSESGGVSGSGTLITFNFQSLSKAGTNNFSFSNNSLCIFSDTGCDYQTGTWVASSVTIESQADVTAPVLSDGLPCSQLSSGTTQTTLSLSTNEGATCKYTTSSGISYDSMSNTFSTTGGTSHSVSLLNISDGNIYNYYIKCKDSAGNKNTSDYIVSFSVALPAEDPPAEDPPAEDPPAEDPPAEDPPAEDPPAEDPPAEDPPAEDPPAEDPPAEDP
ncbi:MAG: cohesin domain-containing protein, partial [Patescibacteria group bacterium]|nr:cohesin domain-containing protein [Patescibacteria group bacterium]